VGSLIEVGDSLIEGAYYQKYGTRLDTYVFLKKSHKAYINVDNIRVVKFPMILADHRVSRNDHVYKLQPEVEEVILEYSY
jgi:hypothetical protein